MVLNGSWRLTNDFWHFTTICNIVIGLNTSVRVAERSWCITTYQLYYQPFIVCKLRLFFFTSVRGLLVQSCLVYDIKHNVRYSVYVSLPTRVNNTYNQSMASPCRTPQAHVFSPPYSDIFSYGEATKKQYHALVAWLMSVVWYFMSPLSAQAPCNCFMSMV